MGTSSEVGLRQALEGMVQAFEPAAAGGLRATIQFDFSDLAQGTYHLRISDGACSFHVGPAEAPSLRVSVPSEVWLRITRGEISAQQALEKGMYDVAGDLGLLLRLKDLFRIDGDLSYEVPSEQRLPGPLRLPGAAWLGLALVPWIIYWSSFDVPGVSLWFSVGLPLLLSLLLVGYRVLYYQSTWLEVGGVGFFALAAILSLVAGAGWWLCGSIIATALMGMLWFGTLVLSELPLSGAYFKWHYSEALWSAGVFVYPNAVITLGWGWQFIVAALVGVAAALVPHLRPALAIVRFMLLALAYALTLAYQRRAFYLGTADFDKAMARVRHWARIGLSVSSDIVLLVAIFSDDVVLIACLAVAALVAVVGFARLKGRGKPTD